MNYLKMKIKYLMYKLEVKEKLMIFIFQLKVMLIIKVNSKLVLINFLKLLVYMIILLIIGEKDIK